MKHIFTWIIAMMLAFPLWAQIPKTVQTELDKNGEVYFSFQMDSPKELAALTQIISIDHHVGNPVFAYANQKEFEKFLSFGIDYKVEPHPNANFNPTMATFEQIQNADAWNFYPTYEAYVSIMAQFEVDHPALCDIDTIGFSEEGRLLLVARITDNIGIEEAEPEFFYTSTMHGDETTGYILMLQLIDSLLTGYGTDPRVTNLVNNMDIYINPLANPDGTYNAGNSTVSGAIRYNSNEVDINRNFPDRLGGQHPDGNVWQSETVAFMNFAEQHEFVISSNLHGGTEVANYPWDATYDLCTDDAWWQHVCHEYADTAQAYSPSGYMNGFDDGITNGAAWYLVYGGRQDLMNYYHQCREMTLELSDVKLVPASQLENHWEYNRRSLLNYMEQAFYGVRGITTNANSGFPLEDVEVYVLNYEEDSSWVYSSAQGNYHRLLIAGTYDIRYSAPCYETQVFSNVTVQNNQATVIDVQMQPLPVDFTANKTALEPGESVNFLSGTCFTASSWNWSFEGGTPSSSTVENPTNIVYANPGVYDVKLVITNGASSDSITKTDFITVSQEVLMTDGSVTTCNALFYDAGGPTSGYSNYEDHILTFNPAAANAKIKAEFLSFDVEYQSSCNYDFLIVYDGPDTGSTPIGFYCGSNSPGTIVSTHTSGALTFQFHSDYSVTASGWEALITCETESFQLDVTAFLEGPFQSSNMETNLPALADFPMDQPYSSVPWSYSGSESLTSVPGNIVDWVLIELRDAQSAASATAATAITRKAALLLQDGSIRDTDGTSLPVFDVGITDQLFVVVYHRNHLPVMSSAGLSESGGVYSWDFTNATGQAFGTNAQVDLGGGYYGLLAGDANGDGQINSNDKVDVWETSAGIHGYHNADLNLDGEGNNKDKNEVWLINSGNSDQVPD